MLRKLKMLEVDDFYTKSAPSRSQYKDSAFTLLEDSIFFNSSLYQNCYNFKNSIYK